MLFGQQQVIENTQPTVIDSNDKFQVWGQNFQFHHLSGYMGKGTFTIAGDFLVLYQIPSTSIIKYGLGPQKAKCLRKVYLVMLWCNLQLQRVILGYLEKTFKGYTEIKTPLNYLTTNDCFIIFCSGHSWSLKRQWKNSPSPPI